MADRGTSLPDLDEFLDQHHIGGCRVCRDLPVEIRGNITAKVSQGINAWSAYTKYVEACGIPGITRSMLNYHYERGHDGR